jgi:alanyl-tRNA synthetase
MTIHQIREAYLLYFQKKKHQIISSASLIPENDSTTLFTGSGMQPMVPYLLGEKHPLGTRIADSQKCFRTQDIEEVGDNSHTTFFEMLGNWSLGDYFKKEQIPWIFEFLTKELGLDANRLYVTVFRGNREFDIERDTESVEIWKKIYSEVGIDANVVDFAEQNGMQDGRIFYYDETKNWWSRSGIPVNMPHGEPGGPDSEMFWDLGEEFGFHEKSEFRHQPCHVNCDCGRFIEIGNNVFMEYQKTETGFIPLPHKNVDFGGGLERIAVAINGDPDIFRISSFASALKHLELQSAKIYGENKKETKGFRVVLDHLRAATFLIGDGVIPSNKDQGYFVRRLIRRAIRFAKHLGVHKGFTAEIAFLFIDEYVETYPILEEKREYIKTELLREEERFLRTLEKGEKEFKKICENRAITGRDAFTLYSTYGFPLELTTEMVKEDGCNIDNETFKKEFEKHRDLSRSGSEQKFSGGLVDHSDATVKLHTATHMLHQALRTVLGDHVHQKGSNITPERLRFDFSHSEKMTDEQKREVERIVNDQIQKDIPVHFEVLDVHEAKDRGALGVFEDKYAKMGGKIKVYFIGDQATGDYFNKEVCGGPHVERTGLMGTFEIKKEESVAAGVRRIKAVLK